MATTTFSNGVTLTDEGWFNDVDAVTYDGATTKILVGGGAGSVAVWTTATGTGAPVRAGAPTFTSTITVDGASTLTGLVGMPAGATVPVTALGNAHSGTYTPSTTGTTNVAAITPHDTPYLRVGNSVFVAGEITVDPTAATTTSWSMSIPVSSNLANIFDLGGTLVSNDGKVAGVIYGDAVNNYAYCEFVATGATNQSVTFQFGYRVI